MADAAAELDEGGLARTLKDLFAGAAGGIAQVLLGEFELSLLLALEPIGYFQHRYIPHVYIPVPAKLHNQIVKSLCFSYLNSVV
jgi:hypothetical protein